MFEEEINLLKEKVRINSINSNDSVILRIILESNIPQSIKNYFKAYARSLVNKERQNANISARLAYQNQDVIALQNQIDLLLLHNYEFSKEEYFSILDQGINFSFNYLIRPQWTLTEFLLQKSQFTTLKEIDEYFQFCCDYNYYHSILHKYFESKDFNFQISSEELKNILKKIDNEVLSSHSSSELVKVFSPIFKLVAFAKNENLENAKIPTKGAIKFFEDKAMTTISNRLSTEKANGLQEVSMNQLLTIIERARTGNNEFISQTEFLNEDTANENKIEVEINSPKIEFEEEEIKIEKEIDLQTEEQKREEIYTPTQPLPPIFTLQEKTQIINNIFDGNENECDSFIVDILDAIDWDDAESILNSFLDENNFDKENPVVGNFISTLKNRYILLRSV